MLPEAAQNGRPHARRMGERQKGRDPRPHGIAHDVAALDAQMIEQRPRVLGQHGQGVAIGIVRLVALPVAAIVERDHPPTRVRQGLSPQRVQPVDRVI